MLELLIAGAFVAAVLFATARRHDRIRLDATGFVDPRHGDAAVLAELAAEADLPCPWCYAPTHEDDSSCRSCGRRFG